MENTRCGKDCCFVKAGICNSDTECPNFVELIWNSEEGKKIKTICDCAPKRTMIQIGEITTRQFALQKSIEQQRNRLENLEETLSKFLNYFVEKDKEQFNKV